jgi:hypothetical protein
LTTLLVVLVGVWMILITWGLGNLYTRPISGLDPDDVDMIKEFMDRIRKIARIERRKRG